MLVRNFLGWFGSRSTYYNSKVNFIPYFQYRIAAYQPDHYLYFPREVNAARYKNEIFVKLKEYKGYDIIEYLEFHYVSFPDKIDFLRFLHYEASERLKLRLPVALKLRIATVIEWISEKRRQQKKLESQERALQSEHKTKTFVANNPEPKQINGDSVVNFLADK
jgi:hypothetical protein